MNQIWTEVRSGRLLKRMASRELISEPPESQRPRRPSGRIWGKGYHYVLPIDGRPHEWDFEGSHYRIIQRDKKFYVWKKTEHSSSRTRR